MVQRQATTASASREQARRVKQRIVVPDRSSTPAMLLITTIERKEKSAGRHLLFKQDSCHWCLIGSACWESVEVSYLRTSIPLNSAEGLDSDRKRQSHLYTYSEVGAVSLQPHSLLNATHLSATELIPLASIQLDRALASIH